MSVMIENIGPLRRERVAAGITQAELAHFCGVATMTISRLERGITGASPKTKVRIARALRVPVEELWPDG